MKAASFVKGHCICCRFNTAWWNHAYSWENSQNEQF